MRSKPFVCLFLLAILALPFASVFANTQQSTPIAAPDVPMADSSYGYQTELVWQYGGTLNAIEVIGDVAYASVGQRLVVLDISLPGEATVIGESEPLSVPLEAIAVQGGYAYGVYEVTNHGSWLVVIDIRDPACPQQVAIVETPGRARDLVVDGTYVYVADQDEGIALVDISDPAQAVYVDNVVGGLDAVRGIEKSGNYIFTAADSDGLVVLNVSDPLNPVQTYQFIDPVYGSDVNSLFLGGGRLLVNDYFGLHIFDVSDLSQPTHLSTLLSVDEQMSFDQSVAYGNYLYAFDMYFGIASVIGGDVGLRIFDINDPENPTSMVSLPDFAGKPHCSQIKLVGSRLFISGCDRGLEVYDLTSPLAPTLTVHHPVDGSATQVIREGTRAYIGSEGYGPSRLIVFDMSDQYHPEKLGSADVDGQLVTVIDGRAYLYHTYNDESYTRHYDINIYDVRNPGQIEHVYQLILAEELMDLAVFGSFAYALVGDSLQVFDISDLAHPVSIGLLPNVYGNELAVAPGYSDPDRIFAYMFYESNVSTGLRVIDVTDQASPNEVGVKEIFSRYIEDIAVQGRYVYLLFTDFMEKYDISDPAAPELAPEYGWSGEYSKWESMTISSEYAYVAAGYNGLEVFDLETLDWGAYSTVPKTVRSVAVFDDYALLAGQESGLYLVWVGPDKWSEISAVDGGTLVSPFDGTQIVFPPGGLEDDLTFVHMPRYLPNTPYPALQLTLLGPAFALDDLQYYGQTPIQILQPFTISVPYNDFTGKGIDETTLALYRLEEGDWTPIASSSLDLAGGLVSAESSLPGTYAVIAELIPQEFIYLPMMGR